MLTIMAAVLSGCELLLQQPVVVVPTEAPAKPEQLHANRIPALLGEAAAAFADNRLTTPAETSAYTIYLQVLALDPANAAAEQGIADIVERYLEWAITNAANFDISKATDYLRRAQSVDAEHPNIVAVRAMIEERRLARTEFHALESAELHARSARVESKLRKIGIEIGVSGASAVIIARNDAEGRWIYQQLNEIGGTRVRAELRFGERPGVRLIYPLQDPTSR